MTMAADFHHGCAAHGDPHEPGAPARGAPSSSVTTTRPRVPSNDILRGSPEVEIDHRGTLYRLRVTSLGKLILTK